MACDTIGFESPRSHAGYWKERFSKDRNFKEDRPFVEVKRGLNADFDGLDVFLQDSEDSVPSRAVREIKAFCQGVVDLDTLRSGAGTAGKRRAAWLDDRRYSRQAGQGFLHKQLRPYVERTFSGLLKPSQPNRSYLTCPNSSDSVRKHPNPLTATDLYELLNLQRYGVSDMPDADRRLIYISHIDPYYILALAETASFHQVQLLKDAIWKHLALQTSIRVEIPSAGFPVFQLEFHLPYFILRQCPSQYGGNNRRPPRDWRNLSFLNKQTPESHTEESYGILEAHISVVICGSDNFRWVAFAFVDDDEEDELDKEALFEGGMDIDPIASDGLDTNLPLWNPKEYFLRVIEGRMGKVLKWWDCLVQEIESNIRQYTKAYSPRASWLSSATGERAKDIKETLYWTVQTIELLRRFLDVLSETLKAWENFNNPNGDVAYFYDLRPSPYSPSPAPWPIHNVNRVFLTLGSLRERLARQEQVCQDLAKELELRLYHEGNEATRFNGAFTEFTFKIVTPIALVLGYFSLPKSFIPFDQNATTLFISIILTIIGVRLIFFLLRSFSGSSWWFRIIIAYVRDRQPDSTPWFLTSDLCGRLASKRRRRSPEAITGDVEMALSL